MILTRYFEKCQEDGKRIETVVRELLPYLKTTKPKALVAELLWHTRQVFASDERVTAVNSVEKLFDFITTVVITAGEIEKRHLKKSKQVQDEDEQVCNETFERFAFHLIRCKFLACDSAYVRRLCCQLFSKLMAGLPSDTDVSEELFTELAEAICDRLHDRSPAVRQQAARAAWRLQDPYDEKCKVSTSLVCMAANDQNVACRVAAVDTIHIPTPLGTPAVVDRLSDQCESVRKTALKRLCRNIDGSVVSVRVLSPEDVRTVLSRVVCEPSVKLRQSYGQQLVLRRWFDEDCRGDICTLFGLFNVETCPDLGLRTLNFFFSSEPERLEKVVSTFKVPEFASNLTTNMTLTPEKVFCWSSLLEIVRKQNNESFFNSLMPGNADDEFSSFNQHFVDYLFHFLGELFDEPPSDDIELHSKLFIGENLVSICRNYCRYIEQADVDRVCDKITTFLNRDLCHPKFVDLLTQALCDLLGKGVPAVIKVAAIVSELLDPEHNSPKKKAPESQSFAENPDKIREHDLHIASLRVRLNEMRDELDEMLEQQKYEEAATCRERIDMIKDELTDAVNAKLNIANNDEKTTPAEDDEELSMGTQQLANQRLNVVQNRPDMAHRLLSVLAACLEHCRPSLPAIIPEIRSLFDDFVVSSIATASAVVRSSALRVLGHYCCIDRDLASAFHSTFIVQLQVDNDCEGQVAAMRVLTEITLVHGFEVFSADCEIANAIASKLGSDDSLTQRVAGECIVQLILSGRCNRRQVPNLLSRLVTLWFEADLVSGRDLDPHSDLLRASLAAFFRMYPTQSASALACFAEALFLTLRQALDKQVDFFTKVKPHAVAMFFAQKLSPLKNPDLDQDMHSQAIFIQHNVALFLLNSLLEAVVKLKKIEDETEENECHEVASALAWYKVISIATCSFVSTMQVSKSNNNLANLHAVVNKLLAENFEWKIPMALVKRRCRKELETLTKNLSSALNLPVDSGVSALSNQMQEIKLEQTHVDASNETLEQSVVQSQPATVTA